MSMVQAESLTFTTDANGNKLYNISLHTGGSANFTSKESNYVIHEGDLSMSNADKMGIISSDKLSTSHGKQEYTVSWGKFSEKSNTGNVTKNVKINGTLTLEGNASINLGGQYKSPTDWSGVTTYDEYTGIVANAIIMNGDGAKLDSYNATIGTLQVDKGTVNLHTNGNSKYGNTHFVVYDTQDSKQVNIQSELKVNGGTVSLGHADGTYLQTSFGKLTYSGDMWVAGELIYVKDANIESSQITQNGGTLKVQGDSVSVGGLNINQTGGSMSISSGAYHDLADYGKSIITQNSTDKKTEMNLGVIRAYNSQYKVIKEKLTENGVKVELKPSIDLTQSGVGTINLEGVDFTAEITASPEKSNISQSGGGIINLNGEYKGVTFDITLNGKGGTLNVNSNLSVGTVTQAAGTINVAENATLTADQIVVTSGTFVNKGTINYTPSAAMLALGSAEDNALLALAGTTEGADIVVAGGQFVNIGNVGDVLVQEGGTLTIEAGSTANSITMEGGQIDITGDSSTGSLTLNGGVINFVDGATVTLSEGATLDISENATIMITVDSSVLQDLAGKDFTLFAGVDNAAEALGNADIVFTDGVEEKEVTISSGSTSGSITVTEVVPEPTTATLSLLALAALAARRRRK